MIILIDRADGTPLSELSPEDFVIIQNELVRESDQDFDYYFNDGTLGLLADAGLADSVISAIAGRMKHRGLDVGWEYKDEPGSEVQCGGSVVDTESFPLGGIRVDLLCKGAILCWGYSRPDGTFQVDFPVVDDELFLRFSGRGDLVLREDAVSGPGDLGQFEVQTLRGSVMTLTDVPQIGVTVSLVNWSAVNGQDSSSWAALGGQRSWGDTDQEGRFAIPVSLPEDIGDLKVHLEVTTVSGDTLEDLVMTIDPEDGFDVGVVEVPEPSADANSLETSVAD